MDWDHLQDWEQEEGPVKVKVFDQDVLLYFPYNHDAILEVKTIEGAEYAAHDKSWTLHVTEENIKDVAAVIGQLEAIFVDAEAKEKRAREHRQDISELVAERLQNRYQHRHLKIDAEDEWITVGFPFHQKSINAIKKIDGRKWDSEEKRWLLPSDQERQIRSALNKILKVMNAGKLAR